jgi:hypothetical protein
MRLARCHDCSKVVSIVLVVVGVILMGFLFSKVEELLTLTPKALHAVRWLDAATAYTTERIVAASIIQHTWRAHCASKNRGGRLGAVSGVHGTALLRTLDSSRPALILAGRAARRQAVLKGIEVRDSFLDRMDMLDTRMHAVQCTIRAIASHYHIALPSGSGGQSSESGVMLTGYW